MSPWDKEIANLKRNLTHHMHVMIKMGKTEGYLWKMTNTNLGLDPHRDLTEERIKLGVPGEEMMMLTMYRRTYRIQGGKILQSDWTTSKVANYETTIKWEEKQVEVPKRFFKDKG